jgi:hypothetical protein
MKIHGAKNKVFKPQIPIKCLTQEKFTKIRALIFLQTHLNPNQFMGRKKKQSILIILTPFRQNLTKKNPNRRVTLEKLKVGDTQLILFFFKKKS